jgi:hypothetical protein
MHGAGTGGRAVNGFTLRYHVLVLHELLHPHHFRLLNDDRPVCVCALVISAARQQGTNGWTHRSHSPLGSTRCHKTGVSASR